MFHIALFEPQIAPNTGNIIRLAANNGCYLHLIEPLGFDLEEKKLRRAGLDYKDLAKLSVHSSFDAFVETLTPEQCIYACTTRGKRCYSAVDYRPGDVLLFGAETHGLSEAIHHSLPDEQKIRIPMQENNRSLNLSNAVAIISYEAWRQQSFQGGG